MKNTVLFLLIFFAATGITTAQHKKILKIPKLIKLWETDTILKDIESAIYHKPTQTIYVSNINGHWLQPNGKGYLSKLNVKGEITQHKWIENLDGPTGMTIHKNKLYVADFNKIIEININTETILKKHIINGAERINDLTSSSTGTIYGTDTKSGKIFALKNDITTTIKDSLNWPNGILYSKNKLFIGLGDKTVPLFDLKSKTFNSFTSGISNPDGITFINKDSYLISSWEGMIHYVDKNGNKELLLDTREEKINAADIYYISELQILLVPAMLNHKLIAYTLTYEN